MMKALPLPFLLAVACFPALSAETAEQGSPAAQLTLDPTLYAEALREVQGQATKPSPAAAEPPAAAEVPEKVPGARPEPSSAPGVEDWQAAMRDAGTELGDVRLLVLLQRLNPLDPPAARAEDYAAALRLHHLMLAGNPRACLELARACREGALASGLAFIQDDALALLLERRAAAFQLRHPLPSPASEVAPQKQEGASL